MVNSIADHEVISFDTDGLIRTWNQGAQSLTGYTADEVIGHHISMFYTAEDAHSDVLERAMAGAVRDGSLEAEGWRVRTDGTRFWANIVLSPIRDDLGDVAGYVKVARDLTERREQERLVQLAQPHQPQGRASTATPESV
jgi:PAS domain S-box-containing protein